MPDIAAAFVQQRLNLTREIDLVLDRTGQIDGDIRPACRLKGEGRALVGRDAARPEIGVRAAIGRGLPLARIDAVMHHVHVGAPVEP